MGAGYHGGFGKTKGKYKDTINSLTKKNSALSKKSWEEITPTAMANKTNSKMYKDANTGLKIRFDKGKKGAKGYKGKDHYHVLNPHSKGKYDYYLDKNGNPVPKNSKASHIIP